MGLSLSLIWFNNYKFFLGVLCFHYLKLCFWLLEQLFLFRILLFCFPPILLEYSRNSTQLQANFLNWICSELYFLLFNFWLVFIFQGISIYLSILRLIIWVLKFPVLSWYIFDKFRIPIFGRMLNYCFFCLRITFDRNLSISDSIYLYYAFKLWSIDLSQLIILVSLQ